MQLSKHLSLAEVTRSDSAKRNGISNEPTAEHLENFKLLAEKVFEPIREHFKVPIHISSGYRSLALNKKIGGSLTSQHCSGEAIDIDMDGSDWEEYGNEFDGGGMDMPVGQLNYDEALDANVDDDEIFESKKSKKK